MADDREMNATEIGRALLGLTDRPAPGVRIGLPVQQPDDRAPAKPAKGVTFASTDGDLALAAAAAYAQGQRQAAPPPAEEQDAPPADKPTEQDEIASRLTELQKRVHALARKQGTTPAALEAAARAAQEKDAATGAANKERDRIAAMASAHAQRKGRSAPSARDFEWAARRAQKV